MSDTNRPVRLPGESAIGSAPDRSSWVGQAKCKDMDTNLFFKQGYPSPKVRETCAACPVQESCLEWHLEVENRTDLPYITGYAGGKAAGQRVKIIKQRRADGTMADGKRKTCYSPHDLNPRMLAFLEEVPA